MKAGLRAVALAVCLALTLPVASLAGPRMPAGSFATHPVTGPRDLCNLIQNDSRTAHRYARHFGLTESELLRYFRTNLKRATLRKPGIFTIYFISKTGGITSRRAHLPAGEPVLTTQNGTPIMLAICGNPMSKALPVVAAKRPSPIAKRVIVSPSKVVYQPLVIASQPEEIPPQPDILPVVTPTEAKPLIASDLESDVEPLPPPAAPGLSGLTKFIAPVLLGAVAVRSTRHSVVPEPGGLLVFGIGATGMISHLLRRKASRRN